MTEPFPSIAIENWDTIDTKMDTAFTDLAKAIDDAIKADKSDFENSKIVQDARKGCADDAEVIFTLDGTEHRLEPDDAVKKVEEWLGTKGESAKTTMESLKKLWTTDPGYKSDSLDPKYLHEGAKKWESAYNQLRSQPDQVGQMTVQQHWQGEGAQAYTAMVPKQSAAASTLNTMISGGANCLYNSSVALQVFYLSFGATVVGTANSIKAMTNPNKDTCVGYRVVNMPTMINQQITWVKDTLQPGKASWNTQITQAETSIEQAGTGFAQAFPTSSWPSSGDGQYTMKPGTMVDAAGNPVGQQQGPPSTSAPGNGVTAPQGPATGVQNTEEVPEGTTETGGDVEAHSGYGEHGELGEYVAPEYVGP